MEKEILAVLKNDNYTISEIANLLKIERHTVSRYLQGLEAKGEVSYIVKGKSKIYSLTNNPFLEIITSNNKVSTQLKEVLSKVNDHISIQDSNYKVIWNNKTNSGQECFRIYANRETKCDNCPVDEVLSSGMAKKRVVNMSEKLEVEILPIKDQKNNTIAVVEIGRKI
ncbi:MAG: helix-turn-helix domain-containing protein [Candidatus Woesearchaeota archaeon]